MIRRVLLILYLLVIVPAKGHAADSEAREKLHAIEDQVRAHEDRRAELEAKSAEANANLEPLRQKLIAATAALNAKQDDLNGLQDKLDELSEDMKAKSGDLSKERRKLSLLTQALIELSQQPPESLLLHAGLTGDTIHRSIVLRAVLPRVREQAESLAHDLSSLDELKKRMDDQRRKVAEAAKKAEEQHAALDELVAARQGLVQKTEEQKQAVAAQLVALTSQANTLRELMEKVAPARKSMVPEGPSSSVTLKTPVAGRILHPFGERDADGVVSEGVTFTTSSGAPVAAPLAGKVVFAGPFKGYGRIVIIQHAGGYHSFMAGFGRIDADMDQDVEAGEPLGIMPVTQGTKPQLYFEWRHNNDPVRPAGLSMPQ